MEGLFKKAVKLGYKPRTVTTGFVVKQYSGDKTRLINDNCLTLVLAEIQKWLRDEHKILVLPEDECRFDVWVFNIHSEKGRCHYPIEAFDTYEKALEAGIMEVLDQIKQ